MQPIRYAAPLFILRDRCGKDLFGVLERLKETGYDGVEFLGFFGRKPGKIRERLGEIGLSGVGDHVSLADFMKDPGGVLSAHGEAGLPYLSVNGVDPTRDFEKTKAFFRETAEKAREYGITLLLHNHDDELRERIGGETWLSYMLRGIPAEDVGLEPDLGWIEIGGEDPAEYLLRFGGRSPVIHLKDYYASDRKKIGAPRTYSPLRGGEEHGHFEFRPTGYGIVNYPKLLPLCLASGPEWLVPDHDLAYERDPFDDLALSLEYVKRLAAL